MSAKTLKIAKEISLPLDAVTQTMAAIGRKGAGKTYLSQMIAEQMLDAHAQVVVIDPVGNWWGLRINADGKTKGKQIFVIGGDQGDVPLVPEAGRRIAQLIVDKGISAVLDVSSFGIGERKRFCADFGEEFFQLKKKRRSPVHLFLEEAQLVVPQNIRPEEGRMYSAYEQIVRLGRNYGIGCTLITQRPQSVNKEVLSQVECLCVLQVTGPHERKALEVWVQEVGADRTLIGELPGLERGEGYVWSPAWLRIYKRVHFSSKQTFDASATPEIGKKTRAASLSAVDVAALKQDISDVVAQAEKDDPVALRRKIGELERDLKKKVEPKITPPDPAAVEKAVYAAVANRDREWKTALVPFSQQTKKMQHFFDTLSKMTPDTLLGVPEAPSLAPYSFKPEHVVPKAAAASASARKPQMEYHTPSSDGRKWGTGERAVLGAVAQHTDGITREHLTVLTGYKRASRNTYLQRLGQAGLIEVQGDKFVVTDPGMAELGSDFVSIPASGPELVEHVMRTLPAGEAKILKTLLDNPQGLERDTITELTEYTRASRNTYIQRLGARQLVVVEGAIVKPAAILI